MARITVEDCLGNVENRFELVMVATKRARQIATGGKDPLVKEDSDKVTVIALREIAEGLVTPDILNKVQLQEEDPFEIQEPTEDEAEDLDVSALAEALAKEVEATPDEEQE